MTARTRRLKGGGRQDCLPHMNQEKPPEPGLRATKNRAQRHGRKNVEMSRTQTKVCATEKMSRCPEHRLKSVPPD